MNICIISFFYKPAGGGIPRYIDDITKQFSQMGHKVDIITASYNAAEVEKKGRITIYKTPYMNIFKKKEEENIIQGKRFFSFLKKYIKKNNPDIFFVQNLQAAIFSICHSFVLNMLALEKNIPLILTIHSFPTDPKKDLKIALTRNLIWDKIIPVSSALAEIFHSEGIPVEKIKTISCGVDHKIFRPRLGKKWLRSRINILEDDILILHASRLDSANIIEEKGIKTLLKAISLIPKKNNLKLLIAAAPTSPPFEESKKENIEKIKNIAKLLGISNKVKIMTFLPEEMPLVYNGADLFVMASQMESFGLVYAEALSCSIPVIGTSVGGIPEIIEDNKSGYLIPPNDPVELSKSIAKLITNEERRKQFGRYGRKAMRKNFDLNIIAKKLLGVFESLLNQNAKPPYLRLFKKLEKKIKR